ncbi:unnamed protein product [Notodromas monacha]|uniref:Uncharacterized protein n=1 Tax=Notodromas monacha TaxID=399045 RepID=A0A7R9C0K5_9CRUS|nr:unnamed protein product [Notodromas monacha]CAG0923566.1 unnamed protein product [Notodromas monacha]
MAVDPPACINPDYPAVLAHFIHLLVSFRCWNDLVRSVTFENPPANMGHPWFLLGMLVDLVGIAQNIRAENRASLFYYEMMNVAATAYAVIGMPFFAGLYHVCINTENRHLNRLGFAVAILITFMPLVYYRRRKRLRMMSWTKYAIFVSLLTMLIQAFRYADILTVLGCYVIYYAVHRVGNGSQRSGIFTNYQKMLLWISLANIIFVLAFSPDKNLRAVVGDENIAEVKKATEEAISAVISMLPKRPRDDDDIFGDYEAGKGKGGKGKGKRGKGKMGKGKSPPDGAQAGKGPMHAGKGKAPGGGKGKPAAGKAAAAGKSGKGPVAQHHAAALLADYHDYSELSRSNILHKQRSLPPPVWIHEKRHSIIKH